jgi:hypothetical protein
MTLNKIAWSFKKEHYSDAEKFNTAVAEYQKDIFKKGENHWDPNEIIFEGDQLDIQYMAWVAGPSDLLENESLIEDDEDIFEEDADDEDYGYQVELVAQFAADNGKNFTALEFLMKVQNQFANKELGDHTFFEGIDETPTVYDGRATLTISCGS